MQNKVFLGIGSNLGNRADNIDKAILLLKAMPGISIQKVSKIYETEPVGGPAQGKFLNAAVEINAEHEPGQILDLINQIEQKLGRERTATKNQPRTIDLDILLFNDLVLKTETLTIPHPLMEKRWFVLKPLCDIAADNIHPVLNRSLKELLTDIESDSRKY